MDGLSELLEKSDHPGIKFNEKIDGFEASEIYSHEGSIKVETRKISDDDVVPWLNQRVDDIVRMVWIKRDIKTTIDPWEDDISKKNQDLVLKYFDLKKAYQLGADGLLVCLPVEDRHGLNKQHFVLGMSGHKGILVWTHDFMTNRTEALWNGDHIFLPFSLVRPVLECQKQLARHPMFLALVAAICISQSTQAMIEPICNKINQVENRTQHGPPNLLTRPTVEGNYAALSAMMSGSATHLAGFEGRIQNLRDIFDSISGYKWPHGLEQPEWAEAVVKDVDQCVSILKKRVKGQEQRIRYLSHRADIQLTALFNLITQHETRLSISVAEDSRTLALATKDDSTAMRTLAAVTVFFLPGTFVAAFFSMPLFHWDPQTEATSTVVSRQFWVYWAVTGPLTLGTLALWLVWMRLQTRRRRARDSEGREALHREIDAPQREFRKRLNGVLKRA